MSVRYPVGDGTKENFNENWYIADGFGSYREVTGPEGTVTLRYYHSGADINLRTGGDTDLGQPIYAISDGRVEYYHYNSHPTRAFGRHNVYKIDGLWGSRWVHGAHCLDKDFVKDAVNVNKGDLVGRIGKSGTGWAHLHLSIYRVDPKTLRNGIDTIARNITELEDWWEDPIEFIEKYYDGGGDMPNDEYGDMVWKSTQHDETVEFLYGPDADPRQKSSKDIQNYINGLRDQLKNCEEQSGGDEPGAPEGWVENGLKITTVEGNVTKEVNYKKE